MATRLLRTCECGCGQVPPIAKRTRLYLGHVKGEPVRFMPSHNSAPPRPGLKREKSPLWRGGRAKRGNGYVVARPERDEEELFGSMQDEQGYIYEHRLVMARHLGRPLESKEVVHHINEDIEDNRLVNLMLFANNGEHTRYHYGK